MNAEAPSAWRPAGPAAEALLGFTLVLSIGAALIFVGTMALLAIALRRPPSQVGARRWLLGGGVLFPLVVLVALFVYSVRHSPPWKAMPPAHALIVGVTGHMWWWELRYRDPRSGREVAAANELRIPVGRPVYLGLSSADAIHSFWVPALGGKMDMLPGRMQHLLVQADRPGVFRGQCAEFCGTQHARMALHVVAMAPADFDAWLDAQARPAAPAGAALQAGRDAFLAHRCDACHAVRGVSEGGRLGPDLTHVGSRLHLGAGTLPMGEAQLTDWIAHTQRHKPGALMPSSAQRIDEPSLRAIAAWLAQLK